MPGKAMSYKLNDKEQRVFDAFPKDKSFIGLSDLAGKAFGSKRGTSPKSKGNSWVRNSLRKLVSLKLVKFKGARTGEYCLTGNSMPEPPPPKPEKVSKKKSASKAGAKVSKPKKKKSSKKNGVSKEGSEETSNGVDLSPQDEEAEEAAASRSDDDDDDDDEDEAGEEVRS